VTNGGWHAPGSQPPPPENQPPPGGWQSPPPGTAPPGQPPYYPPPKEKKGCARNLLLVIAGVVIGGIVLIVLIAALIGGAAKKVTDDSKTPASVNIEAAPSVCWLVTLTGSNSSGLAQNQQEGCGNGTFNLGTGLGRNVVVTKKPNLNNPNEASTLTAVLIVDGKEKTRQSTNAMGGSVTLSP
jgi:hypothetical protein